MKKVLIILAIATLIGGCATATPQFGMRYELDGSGNMVQRQYVMPTESTSACVMGGINWCIATLIGVGVLVGVYGLDRILSDDDPEPVQQANTPWALPAGGSTQTSYSNSYILPDFQVVN